MASLIVQPALIDRIKAAQKVDLGLVKLLEEVGNGDKPDFSIFKGGVLRFRGRLCVPVNDELKRVIIEEAHRSLYTVHPGSTKMYQDLRGCFWWNGLPRTLSGQDAIWVIVDRLTKTTRFVPIKASIGMAPYEALYVRRCRSPLYWDEVGERKLLGPEIILWTIEKIDTIRARIKAAQSQQKSYLDKCHHQLEFEVGDKVFLRIAQMKGVMRFGKKGKFSPRYIGPFEILDQIGPMAYRVALPPASSEVHNVFHVSMLRKYIHDPTHVIDHEPLQIQENITYTEEPVQILDRKE
ncbi:uncharacterized protein LOC121265827 [Juglans microcarpa x Juglans regia]|uniref:uncharacterized protein LOC121265827 n=1 Tax=Juglans microcarpa x Juglans regia TaxID=2249226 RepID=UPI001B7EA16C|nr:uncharacterized protein LOC121265827 [Juglans microcarpa x Juglans regia]